MKKPILLLSTLFLLVSCSSVTNTNTDNKKVDAESILFPPSVKKQTASLMQYVVRKMGDNFGEIIIKNPELKELNLTKEEARGVKKIFQLFFSDLEKQIDYSSMINQIVHSSLAQCNHFTEKELLNIQQFHQTPVGISLLEKINDYKLKQAKLQSEKILSSASAGKLIKPQTTDNEISMPLSLYTPQELKAIQEFYNIPGNEMIFYKQAQFQICVEKVSTTMGEQIFTKKFEENESKLSRELGKVLKEE
ncbi:Uncharacterized protein conserved in bacteria [Neisseria zoodegmatis]|uniref:Uncharacterized protein conserved in bacteria n=1 Tax=Neisseria zoodegmatis TaxID=326523 RepID=A0A378WIZ8_9NEIS|nr:hypothetical protein [Neisseria zoodegmatis]SUA36571.1 Uncharacterized protein conserved in bacteria [Neisseria zoodegmatis]